MSKKMSAHVLGLALAIAFVLAPSMQTAQAATALSTGVDIIATVQEALVFTVDANQVNLTVDPSSPNGGTDTGSTTLSIKTNAGAGFTISAVMDQPLTGSGFGDIIANATGATVENIFAYGLVPNDAEYKPFYTGADVPGADLQTGITDTANSVANPSDTIGGNIIGEFNSTLYYWLNVDFTTAADIYTATVTYTATPSF